MGSDTRAEMPPTARFEASEDEVVQIDENAQQHAVDEQDCEQWHAESTRKRNEK